MALNSLLVLMCR